MPTTSPTAPVLAKDISVTDFVTPAAITPTSVLLCEEAEPVTLAVTASSISPTSVLVHANTTPSFKSSSF